MHVTSLQEKQKKSLESTKTLLENGLIMDSFHLSKPPEDIGSIASISSSIVPKKKVVKKISVTVESDNETISNDRSNTCKRSSQSIKSFQTSDQVSTSKEKVFVPSWKWPAKDSSTKLWLPTEIDCAGSPSNWLNGSFISTESNSWFSIKKWSPQSPTNLQKTSLPLSMFSIAESMEEENTKAILRTKKGKPMANKSKKVRLHLKPEDQVTLKKWFGCVRYTYNWALSCIKENPKNYKTNMKNLRKQQRKHF